MKYLKYIILIFIGCSVFSCSTINKILGRKSTNEDGVVAESKSVSKYEKLFQDKEAKTAKGLFTIHQVEDKIYIEIPDSLLNKNMLMGMTVEQTSDSQESYIGARPEEPIVVSFDKIDSLIYLKEKSFNIADDVIDQGVESAIKQSTIGSIVASFPIKAQTPDSTASVIDVTSLFMGDLSTINPLPKDAFNNMGGWIKRTPTYKNSKSMVLDVMAFDDNISVLSSLSYDLSLSFLGIISIVKDKPYTTNISKSIMLLPDKLMESRNADPRVGVKNSKFTEFSNTNRGSKEIYYSNRWKLEPKDKEGFISGKLSEPRESILFYIDNKFPVEWIESIENSIAQWNKAFEKIGFKDAIQTRIYPEKDSTFNEGNIKYSYIRYITSLTEELRDNIWVDPRSGEIISANIYISHNIAPLLQRNRFIQTGASDHSVVNSLTLDKETFKEALSHVLMRSIGHCLGLKDNMAASFAYPTDSLRSAKFTQEYGLSSSVMDDLPFNFIASADDVKSGTKLAQHQIGAYDYFAIKWLYEPLLSYNTKKEKEEILQKWIMENSGNASLRYGKVQDKKAFYDPRAMALDLGNDNLKAASYAFKNISEVMKNADTWLNEADYDYSYRFGLFNHMLNETYEHVKQVFMNIGGIYINEKYVGDNEPSYVVLPKKLQKESLIWIMNEIENMDWLDNAELLKNTGPMGSFAEFSQKYFGNFVFFQIHALWFSESKSDDPYTQIEAMQDVMDFLWKDANRNKVLSEWYKFMQSQFVGNLIAWSSPVSAKKNESSESASKLGFGLTDEEISELYYTNTYASKENILSGYGLQKVMGMDPMTSISYESKPDRQHIWFGMLRDVKKKLENASRIAQTEEMKSHYLYLLYLVNKAIDVSK